MSHFGADPGDLTPAAMHGRDTDYVFAETDDRGATETDRADCTICLGKGTVKKKPCADCLATGHELTRDEFANGIPEDERPDCPDCKGKGYWGMGNCCDRCLGLCTVGWLPGDADNECSRRGEAADAQKASDFHGGSAPFNDAERAEVAARGRFG